MGEIRGLVDDQQEQRVHEDGSKQNRLAVAQHAIHVLQEQDKDGVEQQREYRVDRDVHPRSSIRVHHFLISELFDELSSVTQNSLLYINSSTSAF